MKRRTALNGLFGLIIIVLLINAATENDELICDGNLLAKVGEDATLGCRHKSPRDVTDKSIEWKFKGTIGVLVYRSRGFYTQDQAEQFKERASQDSSWDPTEGNLAVKISSVKTTDAGEYTCSVRTGYSKISCSITLNIQSDSDRQAGFTTSQVLKGGADMVTLVTLVTLVLAASAMLCK